MDAPLKLPLPPTVALSYAVMWEPPDVNEPFYPNTLPVIVRDWTMENVPEPLREPLLNFLDSSLFSLQTQSAYLPPELLDAMQARGLSEEQEHLTDGSAQGGYTNLASRS